MNLTTVLQNAGENTATLKDAMRSGNLSVLMRLLGPAIRGFLLQRGKAGPTARIPAAGDVTFNWSYASDQPRLAKLYEHAKADQWDGATDLDWSIDVDPLNSEIELMPDHVLALNQIPTYRKLSEKEKRQHRYGFVAWLLSQFLHGEQGALFAACQVTQGLGWYDGKLYGSTQVVDEGRHVEVFHRYLSTKLDKVYQINDNLYVVIDALMTDSRWDLKFLGMQIMVEGLALGAFGAMRMATEEPLLKELLKRVITDEARHVHYGVVALEHRYKHELSERERREREDWAFEMALLMRNRFLAFEFYEEFYAQSISRKQWEKLVIGSAFMQLFRKVMFRRIIPNLKRINLLSDRIRPHYEALGLLEYEHGKAAPDLTAEDLLNS